MSDDPQVPPPSGPAGDPGSPVPDSKLIAALNENILRLAKRLEATNLADIAELTQKPWRLMWVNFIGGTARGVGLFVGGGVMGAVTLGLISWLVYHALEVANYFPVIGHFTHAVGDVLTNFLQQHPAKK